MALFTPDEIADAIERLKFTPARDAYDLFRELLDPASRYEVVTTTNVLTAAESGKTFFLAAAAGFVTTLPAPALGLEFTFIVKTPPTSNGYFVVTSGGADIGVVSVNELETDTGDDGPSDDNADSIKFVENLALAGDILKIRCDGTLWYAIGQARLDGAVLPSTT